MKNTRAEARRHRERKRETSSVPICVHLRSSAVQNLLPWLDGMAILAWGILLLKYSLSSQLQLLIHPHYFWLVYVTGVVLLLLGGVKIGQLVGAKGKRVSHLQEKHLTLFPPGYSSGLLVGTAILGLVMTPSVLKSETALQRGIRESLPLTRAQPQAFGSTSNPEERSLIDWIRTLNAYPEPDAYIGEPVKVKGFVVHLPQLPDNYILVARFVITCCAVDAYPVGLPVKLKAQESRSTYPPDTWIEVEGEMISETLPDYMKESANKRQLVIDSRTITQIETPSDPYHY